MMSSYYSQLNMIGLTTRLFFQALAMHYFNNETLKYICAFDCSVKLFTTYMADNIFYCLSYCPLPLSNVGYDWLLYRSCNHHIFWLFSERFFSTTRHLTPGQYKNISFCNKKFKPLKPNDIDLSQTKSSELIFKNRRVETRVITAVIYSQQIKLLLSLSISKCCSTFFSDFCLAL